MEIGVPSKGTLTHDQEEVGIALPTEPRTPPKYTGLWVELLVNV